MWRARVLRKNYEGRVVVSIPKLFGADPVGPMQAAVDAEVGDEVIVADLNPDAKVRDWWVVGFASQIGRWGTPYPHEHPMGQVVGLVDALAGKADAGSTGSGSLAWADITGKPTTFPPATHSHTWDSVTSKPTTFPPASHTHAQADVTGLTALAADVGAATHLATPGSIPRRFDNGGFRVVTGTHAQDAVNVSHLDDKLTAKMDNPGAWSNLTLGSGVIVDTTQTGPSPRSRLTPMGLQIQSRRMRGPSTAPARDQVFATVPAAHIPPYDILFHMGVQRSGTGNPGASVTMKLKTGTGDIQWVSDPTTNTAQGTGGGPADYITLNDILLVW
jgi:hypothetical protein